MTTFADVHGYSDLPLSPPLPQRILLRHADAGLRAEASVPDAWRALSPRGWSQAADVSERLRGLSIVRVFASPALRCRQTVVPLARALSADVEPRAELAIDTDPHRLMEFLRAPETEAAVLCTHRETIARLFALVTLAAGRSRTIEGESSMSKAALWAIDTDPVAGSPEIRYLSPRLPPA